MENEGVKWHVVLVDHRMIQPRKSKHPRDASAELISGEVCDETVVSPFTELCTISFTPTQKKYNQKLVL